MVRTRALRPALAAAVIVALSLTAFPAGAPAAVPRDFVGIVSDDTFVGGEAYRETTFAQQQAAGIGLIRRTFDWAAIEHAVGQYDFSLYDRFVEDAARHGIRVVPLLFNPPPFHSSKPARRAKRGTYYPLDGGRLGDFAVAVIRRYGPNGAFWDANPLAPKVPMTSVQMWNEPNLPQYDPPRPSPTRYVALLRAAAERLRAFDPAIEIITAGLPDSRLSKPNLFGWIKAMYRAGAKGTFNTLAINPYGKTSKEVLRKLTKVRAIMKANGDSASALWASEFGWSDVGPPSLFRSGKSGQSRKVGQAIAALGKARTRLNLRGFVYYSWKDAKPYPPRFVDFWGLHTGLLARNGKAKPALAAFKRAVAKL